LIVQVGAARVVGLPVGHHGARARAVFDLAALPGGAPVAELQLVLRQPSPHWVTFGVDDVAVTALPDGSGWTLTAARLAAGTSASTAPSLVNGSVYVVWAAGAPGATGLTYHQDAGEVLFHSVGLKVLQRLGAVEFFHREKIHHHVRLRFTIQKSAQFFKRGCVEQIAQVFHVEKPIFRFDFVRHQEV
jgi:hypothetical protein